MACLVILLLFALIQWMLVPDEEEGKCSCHRDTIELQVVKKRSPGAPAALLLYVWCLNLDFDKTVHFQVISFCPEQRRNQSGMLLLLQEGQH